MSVKHALGRGLEFGRTVFRLGILKPAGRVTAKFRGERLRFCPQARSAQPAPVQPLLPVRYRYLRVSLRGLAARLQADGFRRLAGGGSPRTRAVFLAFGAGLGLIEQQLEEDRSTAATCREIQALFQKKKFQSPLKAFSSGYKLEDYVIGKQIGKGCNAAVYEAAAPFAPFRDDSKCSLVELNPNGEKTEAPESLRIPSTPSRYPLAVKMMWNIGAGSSSEAILNSMSQELVPADPQALKKENGEIVLSGHFGSVPKRATAHPNVIRVYRAFTAEVPLLPGAEEEYPAALPLRLNPAGMGNNRTLFLVMKNYPCTLRQYLQVCVPDHRQGSMMLLQLLEGVDHLCRQSIAHRDLKSDNVLLEFDSVGCPRLVITDFGCCLSEEDLKLSFSSRWVNRGGNACLMAPEVATAVPGPGVQIDYSKADAWAVGTIAYEIFGQPNPFYSPAALESRSYQERDLPRLPSGSPEQVRLVVRLLLRRNPNKRLSSRVAANVLHLSLWGRKTLSRLDPAGTGRLADWLLCRSAVVLLQGWGRSCVEAELQRGFLSNLDLEELRTAAGYLISSREPGPSVSV
ncbi:serine/threonine-protein kinase PINK1, mitochondrial [Astyanax mexicanus]|uniref:Serine/threonine-protein kinase PINK1, mitochondrial n=1 Tax=Astyanax mexicanus TaxID=7994 RepID=A0A8T2LDM1_ASTMX|nr:serine/threonine-protein kinase PINK1, mitochondrial [Astyanax mexicanus]